MEQDGNDGDGMQGGQNWKPPTQPPTKTIARADKARSLYASLCFPSIKDFLWILQSNQIKDCPVTVIDAKAAYKIWGPSVAALKGKTVRKQPEPVKTETIYIPKEIRELHKEVTPTIDIFLSTKYRSSSL